MGDKMSNVDVSNDIDNQDNRKGTVQRY